MKRLWISEKTTFGITPKMWAEEHAGITSEITFDITAINITAAMAVDREFLCI